MKRCFLIDKKITFDYNKSQIIIDGKSEDIRKQCCDLLYLLIQNHDYENSYVSFKQIGDTLWRETGGWDSDLKQSLKDCVSELRKALGNGDYIVNVRKKGYYLCCESLSTNDNNPGSSVEENNHNSNLLAEKKSLTSKQLEQYHNLCVVAEELHEEIRTLATNIYFEIAARQIHTNAYLNKLDELLFIIKLLSIEVDDLNSLKFRLKTLKYEYNIDSIEDNISNPIQTSENQNFSNELSDLSSEIILVEKKTFNCQRKFYFALENFKQNENCVIRLVNYFLNNHNKGHYDQFDLLKEKSFFYFFQNLYDSPIDS